MGEPTWMGGGRPSEVEKMHTHRLPDALLFSGEEDASLSVWNLSSTKLNAIYTYIYNILRYICIYIYIAA